MANPTHTYKRWVVFCGQEGVSLRARKIHPYVHSTQLGLFTQRTGEDTTKLANSFIWNLIWIIGKLVNSLGSETVNGWFEGDNIKWTVFIGGRYSFSELWCPWELPACCAAVCITSVPLPASCASNTLLTLWAFPRRKKEVPPLASLGL